MVLKVREAHCHIFIVTRAWCFVNAIHEHIDTTLAYARLYDRTVVADYYRAMGEVEDRMEMGEGTDTPPPSSGELLALVDALNNGTLNDAQREMVQVLRAAILAMGEGEE